MLQANPITSIEQFILEAAKQCDLPFSCKIAPNPNWQAKDTYQILEYEIPLFHELTASEQWLFEVLEGKFDNQKTGARISYGNMTQLVMQSFKCDKAKAAILLPQILSGEIEESSTPVLDSEPLDGEESTALVVADEVSSQVFEFRQKHFDKIEAFIRVSNDVPSEKLVDIFKVTVFMRQRVKATWDFPDTMALFSGAIQEIANVINMETRGGKPAVVEVLEGEIAGDQADSKKNSSTRTGKSSSTKSRAAA